MVAVGAQERATAVALPVEDEEPLIAPEDQPAAENQDERRTRAECDGKHRRDDRRPLDPPRPSGRGRFVDIHWFRKGQRGHTSCSH
jgi:hypothetical protein